MHSFNMPMIALVLFVLNACSQITLAKQEDVQAFATSLHTILKNSDRKAFKKLPSFPNYSISEDEISYVFGKGNKKGISSFMKLSKTKIKIFGPFQMDSNKQMNYYSVVFFDPQKITPEKDGSFSVEKIKKIWSNGFIETVVLEHEGRIKFNYVPFYYGTTLPWISGDYG